MESNLSVWEIEGRYKVIRAQPIGMNTNDGNKHLESYWYGDNREQYLSALERVNDQWAETECPYLLHAHKTSEQE